MKFSPTARQNQIALAGTNMLVVVAPGVESPEVMIAGVLPGAEVVLLNDREDGIAQISRILATHPATQLHLVCHGSYDGNIGQLHLGSGTLHKGNLSNYQPQLQAWGISEMVLYACEVGQDRDFMAQLSEQTGARVAAATGKVGHATLGGNWQLEHQNGTHVETLAFSAQTRQTYPGVLAIFSAQTTFAAGNSPKSVAVGDFNGDGKSDLAVANASSDNVSVLLGNGSGVFATLTPVATGVFPRSVKVADFNSDGKLDLVTANNDSSSGNSVSVLLGNGGGGFTTQTTFAVGNIANSGVSSVVVGDFNGDSKPDLATVNSYSDNVSVLLGNGSGGFSTQTTFAVAEPGDTPKSVAVGDFNGDGKPDLVTAQYFSNNVSVLLGNGSGGFSPQTTFAAGSAARSVAVGDFNSDSKLDIVVASSSDNVSVLLGNGSGGFSAETTFFAAGNNVHSVAVKDFNGDNKLDLVLTSYNSGDVSVLLGDGSGSFSPQTTFAAGSGAYSVAVGDFNGDSKSDLAVANSGSDNMSVLLNTTTTPLILGTAGNDLLIGTAGNDTISGLAGNDTLSGLAGNDSLDGGLGNDSLNGGLGNDTMIGASGNDIYVRDSAGDVITETSPLATEIDTVLSNLPYTLGANLERLTLTGFAAINGVGNALNNILTGNTAANSLFGLSGNDTLTGGLGNDFLVGGAGFDRLTSGTPNDADIIQFNAISDRSDTITDFDRVDNGAIAGDDRDRIQVSNAGFNPTGGASDLLNGVLPAARFVNGTAALGSLAGFRYFPGLGLLFFDSNGGTHDPGVGSLFVADLPNLPTFAAMAGSITVI